MRARQIESMEPDQERPKYIRWIPVAVPLSALILVCGVYFIASEVLSRLMP